MFGSSSVVMPGNRVALPGKRVALPDNARRRRNRPWNLLTTQGFHSAHGTLFCFLFVDRNHQVFNPIDKPHKQAEPSIFFSVVCFRIAGILSEAFENGRKGFPNLQHPHHCKNQILWTKLVGKLRNCAGVP